MPALNRYEVTHIFVGRYRSLLDRWQHYHVRARFDISRQRHIASFAGRTPHPSTPYNANVPPQIYVRCNFCNQAIANGLYASPLKRGSGPASAIGPASAATGVSQGAASLTIGSSKQKVPSQLHALHRQLNLMVLARSQRVRVVESLSLDAHCVYYIWGHLRKICSILRVGISLLLQATMVIYDRTLS